ncbi:hypothetical protein DFA_04613 [Cavenderia fasciculata]|uniref:FHA domain-containing protein n=1 Tax=Cavenderia fasciculata TaxID=261658 RepID=F4PQ22_CACFS|nr:uncharacterized protein DFA_04613 [Cavenderia fasciculata]EGG22485.1 hypothetical protein DFA_04613 [Cavenderia fasciculata]|eukprot:XP_004360336.1 hypothetical protein DFA_04613 [Cavenderia fasciculata]
MSLEPTLSLEDLNFLTPQDPESCNNLIKQQQQQMNINNNNNNNKATTSPFQPQYFITNNNNNNVTSSENNITPKHNNNNNQSGGSTTTPTTYQNIPPSTIIKVNKQQAKSRELVECPIWAAEPNMERNDHLRFVKGGESSHSSIISLEESKFVVFGRSSSVCDYIFSNPTVSRKHCFIAHDFEGRIQVVDFGSSHGTFINKTRAVPNRPYILRHGDKLYLGNDTSYLVAWKSSQNRLLAESLINKRAELMSMKRDESIDSATLTEHEESLNDQIVEFYTTLNKTLLSNDGSFEEIDSLQGHLSQLTPPSPSKKNEVNSTRLVGSKRRNHEHSTPHQPKSVRFLDIANKFIYSELDQVDQSYPTIQTSNVQFNEHSSPSKRLLSPLKKSPITITTVINHISNSDSMNVDHQQQEDGQEQDDETDGTTVINSNNNILSNSNLYNFIMGMNNTNNNINNNNVNQQGNNTTTNQNVNNSSTATTISTTENNNNNSSDEDDDTYSIFTFSSPKKRFKIKSTSTAGNNDDDGESSDDNSSQTLVPQICT